MGKAAGSNDARPLTWRDAAARWLRRRFCRHGFAWSERRQREICFRCGATREDVGKG